MSHMMLRGWVLVAFLSLPWTVVGQTPTSAEALAASVQTRYDGVRDFSADFIQTYRGGILRTVTTERGTVRVRKPGMMRWDYVAPEIKVFVSDGTRVYSYIPEDRQVFVTDVPPDDRLGSPALFLAGKGDIVRDFHAAYTEDTSSEGTVVLRLTPRAGDPDYESLTLTLNVSTLQIVAITARDLQGGDSSIVFSNLQENLGLTDNDFVFRIPRGVDVIPNGALD
jgi:outer membrane lipoprotein carrier protein